MALAYRVGTGCLQSEGRFGRVGQGRGPHSEIFYGLNKFRLGGLLGDYIEGIGGPI